MKKVMVACASIAGALVVSASAQSPTDETLRQFLWQPGMAPSELGEVNVFRRFSSDREPEMQAFYGDVLGLVPLPSTATGGGAMIRYPVGASEVKLFPVAPAATKTAAVDAVVGLRLLTFFYADEGELTGRFREQGYPVPEFMRRADGTRVALTQDPDGEWVELVVDPDATEERLGRFEMGVTVSDLDRSRAFYRDFMGMDELAKVDDEVLGVTRYFFGHRGRGSTRISLWTSGSNLSRDTETAGIQYLVWNVEGVDRLARARHAAIDRPLSDPGTMRTVWLTDPDGVTNYFAQYAGQDNTPPANVSGGGPDGP